MFHIKIIIFFSQELNDNLERVNRDKSVLLEKLNRVREERENFALRVRTLETQLTQKKSSLGTLNPLTEDKVIFLNIHFFIDLFT